MPEPKQGQSRQPAPDKVYDTVIVGAGFGGLCIAIKLLRAVNHDFVVLEKGDEVGGTWRDNRYPGAACDVQSHLYSFSFAPMANWPERYSGWEDLYRYTLHVTERYGLRPYIRFGHEVVSAAFDEATGRWTITTATGACFLCRYWVLATGPLHVPAMPDIEGIGRFQGKVMHSACWDHDYDLEGKRIASIGTGGSAIQYVPEIAAKAERLYVFQRTAAWIVGRDERKYSRFWQKLFGALPAIRVLYRWYLYWVNEARVALFLVPRVARFFQKSVADGMRRELGDQHLAEALVPDYTIGCKRILISNNWLATFSRKNVELVTAPIREFREDSIVTGDGMNRPVDCVVLGTGFVTDPRQYMRGFSLKGRNGRDLQDDWRNGPTAYLGVTVSGYPNMFLLVGPHTALGHNSIIFMIECQVHYILKCMSEVGARGASCLDVTIGAQHRFSDWVARRIKGTVWNAGCRSWYQAADGVNFAIWPAPSWIYWLRTRRVKSADYEFGKIEP